MWQKKLVRSFTGLSGFLMKCNNDIISVNSYLSLPPLPLQSNIHFLFLAKMFLKNENFPKDDITQSCKAKKMRKLGALCQPIFSLDFTICVLLKKPYTTNTANFPTVFSSTRQPEMRKA